MPECVCVCVCTLFGAAAASSSVQGWEEQRYLSLHKIHMPTRGQGRDDRDHSKGCKIEPQPPIGPPLCWTLEASIPPSLALIITKDRMHKTWRTLRQRRPRSPFSPHAEPWNNTCALWPVTLTTHTPSFYPPLFLCHPLPLPLCYCAPWSDSCPRIVYLCL